MRMPKQEYTAEFKELAVKRVKEGLTVGAATKNWGSLMTCLLNTDTTLAVSFPLALRAS